MNRTEILNLLRFAAALDKRTIGETDVLAWHLVLEPLDYQRAQAAIVSHYRHSTAYLTPAHIWAMARTGTDGEKASALDIGLAQICEQGTYCSRCKLVHQPYEQCTVLRIITSDVAKLAIEAGVGKAVPKRYADPKPIAREPAAPEVTPQAAKAMEDERNRQLAALDAMQDTERDDAEVAS